jgi:hypothetical protein
MKNRLPITSWESDIAFDVNPQTASGLQRFSKACFEKIRKLKESLTVDLAARFGGTLRPELLRHAINEADALAASTEFPTLFLPTLAEEKVLLASQWQTKQRLIQERSWLLAA